MEREYDKSIFSLAVDVGGELEHTPKPIEVVYTKVKVCVFYLKFQVKCVNVRERERDDDDDAPRARGEGARQL